MNTYLLLWLVLAASSTYTCFTWAAAHLDRDQDQNTGVREKRDVGIASSPSSHPTVRPPRYTFRRLSTRPPGQTWIPFTGTAFNHNLTEKEITDLQNKTNWKFSRFPTANRFYSTLPYKRVTGSSLSQLNDTDKLASNHHQNASSVPVSTNDKYWAHVTPSGPTASSKSDPQNSKLSLEERYTIIMAVLSAVLFLTLLGFVAHFNRVRKRRKVSITLA